MLLIADSGSTKCDWVLMNFQGKKISETSTTGLNPYFHNEDMVEGALMLNSELMSVAGTVQYIYFYGAGSSSPEMCDVIRRGLKRIFKHADIHVEHDLLGSAMATYDGRPCISCIIGTGSNSCYFDGKEVFEEVPSLAYILGDEASGSYFGKILLREYFYKKLPEDLRIAFEKEFHLTKEQMLQKLYREPGPNTWLASFMRFIAAHAGHPTIKLWIVEGIRHFIQIHVKCFSNWREVPVHFVGSIGHIFKNYLEEACSLEEVTLGRVIQKPIDGLAEYHLRFNWPVKLES